MYYVTNLDPKTDACKLACPETCRNTTFTWLEHARPSTKSRHIIGAQHRGSYAYNVTVNRYNGHITGTNHIVRHVMSLTCTLRRMRANQRAPKHAATQPLHDSSRVPPGRGSSSNFWLKQCWLAVKVKRCYGIR